MVMIALRKQTCGQPTSNQMAKFPRNRANSSQTKQYRNSQ